MRLNKFVAKAAEMHAKGNLSFKQLASICGDSRTLTQALRESERISQEQMKNEKEWEQIAIILDILD